MLSNKIHLLLLFLFLSSLLWSNPFLGGQEESLPEAPRNNGRPLKQLADWQISLKEKMGGYFQEASEGKDRTAFYSLIGLAFLYGVIHAAGPGHRKTVIFSLFLGRRSRWWEPFSAGFFSAGLHGLSGLVLMLILYGISHSMLSRRLNRVSLYFEGFTYLVLLVIALIFFIHSLREFSGKGHGHSHGGTEGSSRGLYATLAASSFFPCPGAVMILMFSLAVGALGMGIWAILSLSIGMGITVSTTAFLGYSGRKGLFTALKKREQLVEKISSLMEMGAYLFLFLYSFWAVTPFLISLMPAS